MKGNMKMKKTTTKYYCDVCGKEVESEEYLSKCQILGRNWDCEGRTCEIGMIRVEICANCFKAWWEITSKYFAEIDDCYGITAKVKYKEHEDENS